MLEIEFHFLRREVLKPPGQANTFIYLSDEFINDPKLFSSFKD